MFFAATREREDLPRWERPPGTPERIGSPGPSPGNARQRGFSRSECSDRFLDRAAPGIEGLAKTA
jgi:hypothetical protein